MSFLSLKAIKSIIISSRPIGWLLLSCTFFAGIVFSGIKINFLIILHTLFFTFPAGVILFGINDISDYSKDKKNLRKRNLISGGVLSKELHRPVLFLAAIFSIIMLGFAGFSNNLETLIFSILCLVIAWGYSLEPLRFKSRPPLELVANLLGAFSLVLIGYSYGGKFNEFVDKVGILNLISLSTTVIAIAFQSYLADFEDDLKVKEKNTVISLGKFTSCKVSVLLYLISSLLVSKLVLQAGFFICFLVALFFYIKPNQQNLIRAYYINLIFLIAFFTIYSTFKLI